MKLYPPAFGFACAAATAAIWLVLGLVRRMIEDRRYCVDIMTQLRAARSAIKSVELGVLETHMQACLTDACHADEDRQLKRVSEIMTLLKKYD